MEDQLKDVTISILVSNNVRSIFKLLFGIITYVK